MQHHNFFPHYKNTCSNSFLRLHCTFPRTLKVSKQMTTPNILTWFTLSLTILITSSQSINANQTQPVSVSVSVFNILKFDQWVQQLHIQSQEKSLKLEPSVVVAGVFCFIAASISSAGGIGGGGLYVPILTIIAGLDLKTASSFSAFMVTGGSIGNVVCNLFATSAKFGGKSLIDYDIALLSEPCMLLGVSVGVICNLVFPEWLITALFAIFLAWTTFKTCKNGVLHWKLESEEAERNGSGNLEQGLVEDGYSNGNEEVHGNKEPLLGVQNKVNTNTVGFPWMKLGILILVWLSFSVLYLLRGNRYGEGIIQMEPCGVGYWVLSSLQIPLAIIFTAWILLRKETCQCQTTKLQDIEGLTGDGKPNKLVFPMMALLAGALGGLFGIGGGMLISPLLLQIGVAPEVTAATCSFMVFFSSTMSAFQYMLLGMEHADTALIFAVVSVFASLLGLLVVQKAIQEYGRPSLIVFSVGIVMVLSTVLMTSFGALDVWKNYRSGTRIEADRRIARGSSIMEGNQACIL